jgi:hypothetical protein
LVILRDGCFGLWHQVGCALVRHHKIRFGLPFRERTLLLR